MSGGHKRLLLLQYFRGSLKRGDLIANRLLAQQIKLPVNGVCLYESFNDTATNTTSRIKQSYLLLRQSAVIGIFTTESVPHGC